MRQLHIGIDIDNVLANSYTSYLERFNTVFKKELKFEEMFNFYSFEESGIERDKLQIFFDTHIHTEAFQIAIPPFQDAIPIISSWVQRGYGLHFITARPVEIEKVTRRWLRRHGLWSKHATLDLFDGNKYEKDTVFKISAAKHHTIDIFIEDNKDIAVALPVPVLLLDMPWNKEVVGAHITRVFGWSDIGEKIDAFVKKI